MDNKQYIIGFSCITGSVIFHGEYYKNNQDTQRIIEEAIALNYGNKYCYIIVSERAYQNLMIGLEDAKKLFWIKNDIIQAKQELNNALEKFKEITDRR